MPYGRPSRLVYSQLPRGAHPTNRTTLGSYRFRIAVALTVTVIYTAFLYRSGAFLTFRWDFVCAAIVHIHLVSHRLLCYMGSFFSFLALLCLD
jgi:hypothetical protein